MKKILLTGSSGFIGRNMAERWEGRYELSCPSSGELNLLDQAAVQKYLEKGHFDGIVHCANRNEARKAIAPYDALDGNLRMFFNLERCRHLYGKMIYFGSGAEYDRRNYIPGMREEYFGSYIPADAYGFSKYIMSKACGKAGSIYDLRLFGVFGKYEEWERRFISNAICRALKGMDITIEKNVYFDYLWVDDLCGIVEWFIDNSPGHRHYNVCRGEKIDLYSLACLVREALGVSCDIVIKEPGWKPEYSGNNERLLREMGGFRFKEMKDAVMELCEYYKNHLDLIDEYRLK